MTSITDGTALADLLSRLGRIERWADLANAQPFTHPQVIRAVENRILHIEHVAEQVVNGALVPELKALGERVNVIGTALDQTVVPTVDNVVVKADATKDELDALTAKLNEFPAQIQAEIAKGVPLNPQSGGMYQHTGKERRLIMEYKVIGAQAKLTNDKKEYRSWRKKIKNALNQVNEDIVKTMDKIESVNWGKAEQVEWLASEHDVRVELNIDLVRWGEIKSDLYAVLMDKTEGDANMLSENDNRDGLMAYMRVNKWYTEQSGQGLADRREAIIRPEEVKKELDILEQSKSGKMSSES